MKDEQFQQIMDIVAAKREEPVSVKHDVIDNLSKLGVALCTAAILWVAAQVQTLTTDTAVMKSQMVSFAEFAEEPRFTEIKNDAADQKLLNQIKDLVQNLIDEVRANDRDIGEIKVELGRRSDLFDELRQYKESSNKRLDKLEFTLDAMDTE